MTEGQSHKASRLPGDDGMKAHDGISGADRGRDTPDVASRRWVWPFAVLFIATCSALGWALIVFVIRKVFS
jgi:hypothetical protein